MAQPFVIYYSSVSENSHRFVKKLGFDSLRLPLHKSEDTPLVSQEYVLVTHTYGAGKIRGSVPKRVVEFLNIEQNRNLCLGVITGGNTMFGNGAFTAGKIISQKLDVPNLYEYEILGTPEDVDAVQDILLQLWSQQV